ncbi:hypothetical protein, partial [Neisseria bacilliformis]|uniref:hypothetical protein n=1 Tax=Neisseria bacilliformis TaxID=267212 RepID=UPI003C741C84
EREQGFRRPTGSLKSKKYRHSRAGGNLGWHSAIFEETNYCLDSDKIPACAGMTTFEKHPGFSKFQAA